MRRVAGLFFFLQSAQAQEQGTTDPGQPSGSARASPGGTRKDSPAPSRFGSAKARLRRFFSKTPDPAELHNAVKLNSLERVQKLLNAGCNPDKHQDDAVAPPPPPSPPPPPPRPATTPYAPPHHPALPRPHLRPLPPHSLLLPNPNHSWLLPDGALLTLTLALALLQQTGDRCLHLAASKGRCAIVVVLLKAGATPDLQNNKGSTALHMATG